MHRIFIGYDERQPVSFNVLQQSIISQASEPVAITPLRISQLPIKRTGLTPFTFSRFLVPHLCDFKGTALFLDIDIVLNGDICELMKIADKEYDKTPAVWVSKNEHKFEWASVMLFNCSHSANRVLTPEMVETHKDLHRIGWLKDEEVGDLPREWNHLVGYDKPRNDAKLVHFTQGIPAYPETIDSEYSELWHRFHQQVNSTQTWEMLMGNSIHAVQVNDKKLPKFLFDVEAGKPRPEYEHRVKELLTAA